MKEKLIYAIYHYNNHKIVIEKEFESLCGWAVELKYAHLFKCGSELGMSSNEDLGIDPDIEISYFTIDEREDSTIYQYNLDLNKPKSILKYLKMCIDEIELMREFGEA
jgi:hypothetical protein